LKLWGHFMPPRDISSALCPRVSDAASVSFSLLSRLHLYSPPPSRWSRNAVRMFPSCRTTSSCPSRSESWTCTCAACPATRSRSWSSAGAPWRTGATPPAAGWSACPSARPWSCRRRSSRGRWSGSGRRTPAWGKSWRGWARAWPPSRGSPGAWRPAAATCSPRRRASTRRRSSPSWRVRRSRSHREIRSRPRRRCWTGWEEEEGGREDAQPAMQTHTHTHMPKNRKTIFVGKY